MGSIRALTLDIIINIQVCSKLFKVNAKKFQRLAVKAPFVSRPPISYEGNGGPDT